MELAWGKVIFIPPGTDLRELTAITVKVDGKVHKVGGTYLEAQQKKELRVAEMARHSTTHATAPATAGT
jgi:hypothetical protein